MYAVYLGEVFVGVYDDATAESQVYPDREDRVIVRNVPSDLLSQMAPPPPPQPPLTLADAVEGQGGWAAVNAAEAETQVKRAQAWLAADTAMAEIGLNDPEPRAAVLDYVRALAAIRNAPPEDACADFPQPPAVLA